MPSHTQTRLSALLTVIAMVFPASSLADDDRFLSEVGRLDIRALMAQEVSSVLRKKQPVLTAASAIYVLTAEDIRLSGARTIPDALRLVPEVTVARINSNSWSVTVRGADADGSSKLLVLIDGRSVYSPFFTGVFWDVQDLMLEDIDRIEVIRGPGAVSWGENAVNGVINIITKSSKDTQGGLAVAGGGNEEQGFGAVRYGGKIGENTSYRVYSKYDLRDSFELPSGGDGEDDWHMARGGFRLDSEVSSDDLLTLQGDIYGGESSQFLNRWVLDDAPFTVPGRYETDLGGGNVLARWSKDFSASSQLQLQTYYDRTERDIEQVGREDRDTYDIDFQHYFKASDSHYLIWGADFRVTSATLGGSKGLIFDSGEHTDYLANLFVEDEITLIPDTFDVIPGTKLGYNDLSGFEVQPSVRFIYTPTLHNSIWGAVSRAVRTPALIDHIARINNVPFVTPEGVTAVGSSFGDREFDSEELMAYELGYRSEISTTFSLDVATFYHRYEDLISLEPGTPFFEESPLPPHLVIPFVAGNNMNGDAYGTGLSVKWFAHPRVELSGTYSYLYLNYYADPDSMDPFLANGVERRSPHHQATFAALIDLPYRLELSPIIYYRDSLPGFNVSSHIRTDINLGWRPVNDLLINVVVQDLFDDSFREYGGAGNTETERGIYGKVTFWFG